MMAVIFTLFIIAIPFISGLAMILFPSAFKAYLFGNILRACAALVLITGLAASLSQQTHRLCGGPLEAAGEMCVSFEKSSLFLVLAISAILIILNPIYRDNQSNFSPTLAGLALAALAAANAAFLAEHFLLRYAALEAAGLCVVGAALAFTRPEKNAWDRTKIVFLNLRLGDIGLLIAIFLMYSASGTFHISRNFSTAANLPGTFRILTGIGLTAAVWVKMAIWPMDRWADALSSIPTQARRWLTVILVPALGAYLLYRTNPLLLSMPKSAPWIIAAGSIASLSGAARQIISNQKRHSYRFSIMYSSVCLTTAATTAEQNTFWGWMVLWVIFRTGIIIAEDAAKNKQTFFHRLFSPFLIAVFSFFLLWQTTSAQQNMPGIAALLWIPWWLHLILTLDTANKYRTTSTDDRQKRDALALIKGHLYVLLSTFLIFAGSAGLVYYITGFFKNREIWIISRQLLTSINPFITPIFWISSAAAAILVYLISKARRFDRFIQRINQLLQSMKETSFIKKGEGTADPIDFSDPVSNIFVSSANFIYEHIEHGSIEKLAETIQRFFSFLFDKIEQFSSTNLWEHSLEAVKTASEKIQNLHHGMLRFNMMLLFILVIILVLIAIGINNGFAVTIL